MKRNATSAQEFWREVGRDPREFRTSQILGFYWRDDVAVGIGLLGWAPAPAHEAGDHPERPRRCFGKLCWWRKGQTVKNWFGPGRAEKVATAMEAKVLELGARLQMKKQVVGEQVITPARPAPVRRECLREEQTMSRKAKHELLSFEALVGVLEHCVGLENALRTREIAEMLGADVQSVRYAIRKYADKMPGTLVSNQRAGYYFRVGEERAPAQTSGEAGADAVAPGADAVAPGEELSGFQQEALGLTGLQQRMGLHEAQLGQLQATDRALGGSRVQAIRVTMVGVGVNMEFVASREWVRKSLAILV